MEDQSACIRPVPKYVAAPSGQRKYRLILVLPVLSRLMCESCGGEFIHPQRKLAKRYCSVECSRKLTPQRRAAAMAGGTINRLDIFNRDGWACRGCGRPVVAGVGNGDSRQATIDHIKPLSRGGEHVDSNCQTLCRGCNTRKHNS